MQFRSRSIVGYVNIDRFKMLAGKLGGCLRVAFAFLLIACERFSLCNPDAKRLYDDLLSNYNRLIRPVTNNNNTVLVKLGLRLSQLIDLVSRLNFCVFLVGFIYLLVWFF